MTVSTRHNPPPNDAMRALREASWPAHKHLEKRLEVKARFTDLKQYRAHLKLMWGLCAGIEPLLTRSLGAALPDFASRHKLPLLSRDLLALGIDPGLLPTWDSPPALRSLHDPATAFGWAYVMEGATLGGRMLLPVVEERLGLTADDGAAFLAGYGAATPAMWQTFSTAVNAWCGEQQRRDLAVEAAIGAFGAFADYLCRDVA